MKIVLRPRDTEHHGQDFRASLAIDSLGLSPFPVYKNEAIDISKLSLVICFDPENENCNRFIKSLPADIPVVTHYHLQWNYQTKNQQDISAQTLSRSSAVIVPATFLMGELESEFPELEFSLIKNGADPKIFHPTTLAERNAFREAYGIPQDATVAIHVGRLSSPKGVEILIDICQFLPENIFLVLYCRKSEESEKALGIIGADANNRVIVIFDNNSIDRNNHPVKYCDILISTSLGEVAPMVVLEALLCGVPVAVTESTPFYTEISSGVELPSNALSTVGIPKELYSLASDKRNLTKEQSASIANKMLTIISDYDKYSDEQRKVISKVMIDNGFESVCMLRAYEVLYNNIVQKHNKAV